MSQLIWIVLIAFVIVNIGFGIYAFIMIRRHEELRQIYRECEDDLPDPLFPFTLPLFGLFVVLAVLSKSLKRRN